MHNNQTELVASELWQAGFIATTLKSKMVRVSLSARTVSAMEVEMALEQIFGELQFSTQSVGTGVLVSW